MTEEQVPAPVRSAAGRPVPRTRNLAWTVLGLVLGLLGLGSLLRQVTAPLPGDRVRWEREAGALVAREVPRAGSPIAIGDRLRSLDGRSVRSRLDLVLEDREAVPGQTRIYELERGGGLVSLPVPVERGRAPRAYLLLTLLGFASLLAGLRLALAAPAPGMRPAALAAFAFALVLLARPVGWMDLPDRLSTGLDELGRLAFPALLVHGTLGLLGMELGRWALALYGPGLLLGTLDGLFLLAGGRLGPRAALAAAAGLERAVLLHMALYVGAALLLGAWGYASARGERRLGLRWFLVAAGLGLGPYCVLMALPRTLGVPQALADLSILPMCTVPYALSNAFLRRRGQRPASRKRYGLALAFGGLLSLGVALGVAALLGSLLEARGLPVWLAFAAVAALAVAGSFERIRKLLQGLAEVLVDREAYEARRGLLAFGREFATDVGCLELVDALLVRVRQAFATPFVALYARAEEEGLELVAATPACGALGRRLALGHGGLPVGGESRLVRLREIPGLRDLEERGLETAVTLVSRRQLVGLLLVGHAPGGLGRGAARQLLADLGGYVGVALENARLHAQASRNVARVKELEAFRSSIIESLDIGILILDLHGRILSSNRALRDLLGEGVPLRPGEVAATVLPPELLDPPREGPAQRRRLGERTLSLSTTLLRRADGSIQGRILAAEDVSTQVDEEQERTRQEKLASVGLLAAGVAHEINTPLAGIASYVQMLLESTDGADPRHAFLKKVETQSFRAAGMVRNLLNFARSREEPEAAIDLNEVLEEALSLLEHQWKRARITVSRDLHPGLPGVWGRHTELVQVAVNLIKNALDAMEGGGALRLVTGTRGGQVFLRIEDTGHGIAGAEIGRVFEPFFTTKGRGRGHGLGLAVSFNIVKAHGGDLRIDSEPGAGTRVTVSLTAVAAPVEGPRGASRKAGA